ncbi:DUF6182 family protein [Saccharopolyspora sp. ID03-671]|uniref:DUF6182 family protein n=1 Tax=Saccharopolyspora sp. ID03-671 TaxID=3073066 RepID=UPI00324D50BD
MTSSPEPTALAHAVSDPSEALPPASPPQSALLRSAVDRVRTARPELADRLDLSSGQALKALRAGFHDADAVDTEVLAVVVVSQLDLPQWVRETCTFALALAPETRDAWRSSFTRTVFLAGNPANLHERFTFDHVAGDGSLAWSGPAPGAATATLRRLLKTFEGGHELTTMPAATVTVPRPAIASCSGGFRSAVHRDLYIATARVTVAHALVHINHLLAEAVLDGLIQPCDRLTLRFVPRLNVLARQFAMLRVDTDVHRPDELQAYAGLTTEV